MKTLHFYCHPPAWGWDFLDEPIVAEDEAKQINSLLTYSIVSYAIAKFASGVPPYTLTVPSEFVPYLYDTWKYPARLVQIVPKENRKDCHPYDTCELQFKDTLIVFHALRLDSTPIMASG